MEQKPGRGFCLTTSTVGWKTLQHYRGLALPWLNDLDEDGNAELIIWDSFFLDKEAQLPAVGLMAWVYRLLPEESFVIDWELTRQIARNIAEAYRVPLESTKPYFVFPRDRAALALQQFAEKQCTIPTSE